MAGTVGKTVVGGLVGTVSETVVGVVGFSSVGTVCEMGVGVGVGIGEQLARCGNRLVGTVGESGNSWF